MILIRNFKLKNIYLSSVEKIMKIKPGTERLSYIYNIFEKIIFSIELPTLNE